jgi:hypothetical protein
VGDWWDWIRWGGTTVVALGALTLGVRSELRAARYKATFVIASDGLGSVTIANTTGEAAANVAVFRYPDGGSALYEAALLANDEPVTFPAEDFWAPQQVAVSWVRPFNGYRYRQLGPVSADIPTRPLRQALAAYKEQRLRRTSKGRRQRL